MRATRLGQMEQFILSRESVSMEALGAFFGISPNTVRRDVALLLKRGTVEKVYGGVIAHREEKLTPFDVRTVDRPEAKAAIGRCAADMVGEGDIIFVDSGTTTLHLVQALGHRCTATLITHNLHAVTAALPYPNLTVIALPGQLQRKTCSLTGLDALRLLRTFNIKTAFMAATGLSLEGEVTNASPLEYEIKMLALERSQRAVLMLDSHKFGRTALMTYAHLNQFESVITEAQPDAPYAAALQEMGVKLMLAGAADAT